VADNDFDKFKYTVGAENLPPADSGEIRWSGSIQTSSSQIYISLETTTPEGGEVELTNYYEPGNTLFIADASQESNFQVWTINHVSRSPGESYLTLDVSLLSSSGKATEGFFENSRVLVYLEEASLTSAGAVTEPIPQVPEKESFPTPEVDPEVDNREQEAKLEKKLANLKREQERLEARRAKLDEELSRWDLTRQQLAAWHDRHSRSFLWKTLDVMNHNLEAAKDKLARYDEIVKEVKIPNPGKMQELRKKFHKRLLTITIVIPAICALLIQVPRWLGLASINEFLSQYSIAIPNPTRTIVSYAIALYLILLVGALITYYKGWSGFERKVRVTLWELTTVAEGVNHVRNEELRLRDLYPKIKEWLEILGNSLTNPWLIRDEWLAIESTSLSAESLPFSLRVAQPNEGESSSNIAMQREAAEKFMVRGWRAKVFEDQVDVIRQSVGMSEDRMNVEQLDKDLSYSPNGPRAMVYRYITDEAVLEKVGRRQLIPLIAEVQQKGMTETRPPVGEIRKRNAAGLRKSKSDIDEEKQVGWDEFLSVSIPLEGKPRTPLSVLGLSDEGKMRNYQDKYESFVILPLRFESRVNHLNRSNVHTYEEHEKLPIDLVVRTDFTGPVSEEHLLFLVKSGSTKSKDASKLEESLGEKIKERKSGIE